MAETQILFGSEALSEAFNQPKVPTRAEDGNSLVQLAVQVAP